MILSASLLIIISYFIGTIPFSFIVPKLKGIDVRKKGSGNVGGTNVLRNLGFGYGLTAMVLDCLKGLMPGFVGVMIYTNESWIPYLMILAAVLGHDYSVFLKFKGGKGVATTVGGYISTHPLSGFIFFLIWFPIAFKTKYVSLASITSMFVVSILVFIFDYKAAIIYLILAGISAYKHRSNIKRLINGEENKTDILNIMSKGVKK